MTATLDAVTKRKARPEPSAEQKLAEELVARAREQGVSLTGPEGLLKQLTKTVLETALDQELTEHLGHEKHGPAETGNVRNGTRPKTVLTEASGQVGIEVPRDRAGTSGPQIVRKRQRRLTRVDEMVLTPLTRTDALYFSVTVFSTVGFGDITAKSQGRPGGAHRADARRSRASGRRRAGTAFPSSGLPLRLLLVSAAGWSSARASR
jgi:hypothetical protein